MPEKTFQQCFSHSGFMIGADIQQHLLVRVGKISRFGLKYLLRSARTQLGMSSDLPLFLIYVNKAHFLV